MAARKKKAAANADSAKLDHIAPQLRDLAVPIADLRSDARNVRLHSKRNLQEVRKSLRQFGQQQPVVVQRSTMTVVVGNARLQCAKMLGWTHIAANVVDLDDKRARALAIADNRTSDLSEFDEQALATALAELRDDELIDYVGYNEDEIDKLLEEVTGDADFRPSGGMSGTRPDDGVGDMQYSVQVVDLTEKQQAELLTRLEKEGFRCKALMS